MDCPPIIGLSDALILARIADISMITVSAKKTKMENLEKAKKQFEQANIKISGVILNQVPTQGSSYYNYYYNSDYYGEKTDD